MRYVTITLLALLLGCAFCTDSFGQVQGSRKYRIVAYKNGAPQIFSISNEVEIIPQMSYYIPNTFTPNGDGLNDTFGIAGEAIKEFKLQIFNRWGQLVFESGNPNDRWDGTYQGDKVSEGVYVYKITAQGTNGKSQSKEGNLNVIL